MSIADISWAAALVAAIAAFMLGGLWYGPLFGKRWQSLIGLTDEQIAEANMAVVFGCAFILTLIEALALSALLPADATLATGAGYGAVLALAFVVPAFGVNYLFARHPPGLWLIDAGFMLAQFVVLGLVIGGWP